MSEPDRPDVDDPRSSAEQREAELGGSGSLLVRQRKDHALSGLGRRRRRPEHLPPIPYGERAATHVDRATDRSGERSAAHDVP